MSNDTTYSDPQPAETPENTIENEHVPFSQIADWVTFDQGISDGAFRLYMALLSFDFGKGAVFPSQELLAERLGVSTRAVIRRMEELIDADMVKRVKVSSHAKQGHSRNRYMLRRWEKPNRSSTGDTNVTSPTGDANVTRQGETHDANVMGTHDANVTLIRRRENNTKIKEYESPKPPTAEPEQGELAIVAESAPPAGGGSKPKRKREEYPPEFAAFWEVYPKKVDKRAALKAWRAAKKRVLVSDDELVVAAMRYRDDPNRDEGFTKNPATWLRADSWENGPLPARNRNDWNTERQNQNRQVMMNAYQQEYGNTNPMMGELGK